MGQGGHDQTACLAGDNPLAAEGHSCLYSNLRNLQTEHEKRIRTHSVENNQKFNFI